jgi:hypothetical protein
LLALLADALPVRASDPGEITATAYLRSNRVDWVMQTDFQTGLRLAGVTARRPAAVSVTNWFAQHQPELQAAGKSFCRIQSGPNGLPVRAATVTLGVENQIETQVEFPPVTAGPLRFAVPGLKVLAADGHPSGIALTVVDMVGHQMLGQRVVFADAPILAVDVRSPAAATAVPPSAPPVSPAARPAIPPVPAATPPKSRLDWPSLVIIGGLALLVLAVEFGRRRPPAR